MPLWSNLAKMFWKKIRAFRRVAVRLRHRTFGVGFMRQPVGRIVVVGESRQRRDARESVRDRADVARRVLGEGEIGLDQAG